MAKDGRGWFALLLASCLSGCGSRSAPPFPTYSANQPPTVVASDNGFGLYLQAADDTEAKGAKFKGRVSLASEEKKELFEDTDNAIKLLDRGSAMNVQFAFTPQKPFEARPHQQGWWLIGKSLEWRISDAVRASQPTLAINYLLLATKFGFDLTAGAVTDASLGLSIADNARRAFLPLVSQLSPGDLQRVAEGLQKILKSKPDLSRTIANEKQNMLAAVDYIQDAYRRDNYDDLIKRLGPDVRDAVKYLQKELKPKDEKERPGFFEGLSTEANQEAQWETEQATLPGVRRTAQPDCAKTERPWRRWAKHFFQAGRPLIEIADETVARTRLLSLHCLILVDEQKVKKAPSSLAEFAPDLILDPFTGGTFIYRAQGLVFKVYSAGDNFRDDGGQTDAAFTHPDLMLEVPG